MAMIVNDDTPKEDIARFLDAVNAAVESTDKVRVAFDCEGVNLSRTGTVELVSLCFDISSIEDEGAVFLVDLGEKCDESKRDERVQALKRLFECETVEKIIHDCRMDCDALWHLHQIKLKNVHDISCFHAVITGREDKNLNDVLSYNGIEENAIRDKSIYRRNPAFWATRPLTKMMIEWASSDVDKLLIGASKQVDAVERFGGKRMEEAQNKSTEYTTVVRNMKLARDLKVRGNIGRFLGKGGCNVRSLQKRTGTMIYRDWDNKTSETWMVFYETQASLASVKGEMG
jgi:exonuclease 3'-5' domain-containing protein 1